MRDYGKVSPKFWIGETGKKIRSSGANATVIALYLMTGPHSNMLGLYYLPKIFIAHETGLGLEGASEGLQRCIEAGFCAYDEGTEFVWVYEMAAYQIEEALDPKDNRCKGIQRDYLGLPENPYVERFFDRYARSFNMPDKRYFEVNPERGIGSPFEAPSKPGTGTGTRTRAGTGEGAPQLPIDNDPPAPMAPTVPPAEDLPVKPKAENVRGMRLPKDWALPRAWGVWALETRKDWDEGRVRLEGEKFRDHWHAKAGKDASKVEWEATWRNWVRRDMPTVMQSASSADQVLGKAGQETAAAANRLREKMRASS